jgi:hypothetical protein
LNETLLRGLEASRDDGTVLRVLPVLLARNLDGVEWGALKEDARRRKLKAELGFLVELSAALLGKATLRDQAQSLADRRRRRMRFYPHVKNRYEEAAAKTRSPEVATRWGFWMNLSEDSFRGLLEKHGA